MKKVVLSGSAKFCKEIEEFKDNLNIKYEVINYPKLLNNINFNKEYPIIYKNYFESIRECDTFIALNFDKNNILGYIGAETFAELSFALLQNMLYGKKIEIYLLKKPDEKTSCYTEVKFWLDLGYIKIWGK